MLFPIRERGVDTDRLMRASAISATELEHPHNPIPISKYLNFMSAAAREADDPLLGLRLASDIGAENLGALGFLFLSSPTIHAALKYLCHYETLLQDVTHMSLWQEGGDLWWSYELYNIEGIDARQDIEFSIALTTKLLRHFGGSKVAISGIQFRHDPAAPIKVYESLLGTNCAFRSDSNTIRIPMDTANLRGNAYDPHLLQILEDYLNVDLEKKMRLSSFADQLEHVVHAGHLRPPITAQKMASHLGMSTATLNRRLRQEGLSFKELVDRAHYEIARNYLSETSMSVTQISHALGFSNLASFSRAFSRWSNGNTPRAYRAEHNS